ncbi:MAG TPA: EthD family reductase [Phenylobacterium sp.]|jgi:uncharacterized protein (TIGR02118 family)|nr:EthD family reductase [Phenylobacterium sp.]
MVVFSVIYPAQPDGHFDEGYYFATHIPMVQDAFTRSGLKAIEIHKGLSAGDGGPAPFVIMAHLTFESPEALQASLSGAPATEVFADIAKFTNIQPLTQVSAPHA